ncbi:FAD binding domain-containing protein [Chloroflexota bacterium]
MYIKRLPDFEYLEPKNINEACTLLQKYDGEVRVLAGGTDLLVNMKRMRITPKYLIGLRNVSNLDSIIWSKTNGLYLGAMVTLQSIIDNPVIEEKFSILASACSNIGPPYIRSHGTIGGNLCQDTKCLYYTRFHQGHEAPCFQAGGDACYAVKGAKRCSAMAIVDSAPALICLGATVCIAGPNGERICPIEDFFISSGLVNLHEGEILTGIQIPYPSPHSGGVYLRHSLTGALGFALASVAVVLIANGEVCEDARISLLGVARVPIRAKNAENLLKGKKIDNLAEQAAQTASSETHPMGDIFGSARYKKEMVKVLAKQAICQAWEQVKSV